MLWLWMSGSWHSTLTWTSPSLFARDGTQVWPLAWLVLCTSEHPSRSKWEDEAATLFSALLVHQEIYRQDRLCWCNMVQHGAAFKFQAYLSTNYLGPSQPWDHQILSARMQMALGQHKAPRIRTDPWVMVGLVGVHCIWRNPFPRSFCVGNP